jgi:hypothetical protein
MDTDDIDSFTLKDAVREVLDTIYFLGPGDTTTDDGDVGVVETNSELEVICDVAEPGFASGNGPYATEGLVLKIDALSRSVAVEPRAV